MREQVSCPVCKNPLETELIADFLFCKECELAVRSERDMPLSDVHIYGKDWVRSQENDKANFLRASNVVKQVKKLNGIRFVLDVGCGTGILVDALTRRGYIAEGIDSSPDAIEFAKSVKKGNFYLSSIESFKSEKKYDLIIATQLIEHLRNPEVLLVNLKKLLKPSGYLYVETPNLYSWNKQSKWRRRIGGMFYGSDHRILYTPKSLARLFQKNSFIIYKVFTRTYSPTIFVETMDTLIPPVKNVKSQKEPPEANVAINGAKYWVKRGCRSILRRFKNTFIISLLLLVPNRISEINNRGNQLTVIAKNDKNSSV